MSYTTERIRRAKDKIDRLFAELKDLVDKPVTDLEKKEKASTDNVIPLFCKRR